MSGPVGGDVVGRGPALDELWRCFEGAVPAVVATASADGTPNVTYLSRVHRVDGERVALSNQFFSKTSRNLAENPRAAVLLIDPTTYDEFRLELAYERTERRGPVFERLAADVDALAVLEGMQDVFRLRAADVYRVLHVEQVVGGPATAPARTRPAVGPAALADLCRRLARAGDLDAVVASAVGGLADLGYDHALLLLLDEGGERLYTIASHGFEAEGVGSEIPVGDGLIGRTAQRCEPLRVGNLRQMAKYSATVKRAYEAVGVPDAEIAVPRLPVTQSRVAVPAVALGELVGVLAVESEEPVAFDEHDEDVLVVVAAQVAAVVVAARAAGLGAPEAGGPVALPAVATTGPTTAVRHYVQDGSTFLDGDYLIKGVPGRILWSLLRQRRDEGREEFTNREVRLDASLELPAYRDNLEARLILLKRRLDERGAPVRIEKTGRGRFRVLVDGALHLEEVPSPT